MNVIFIISEQMEFVRLIRARPIGLWWGPHIRDFMIDCFVCHVRFIYPALRHACYYFLIAH